MGPKIFLKRGIYRKKSSPIISHHFFSMYCNIFSKKLHLSIAEMDIWCSDDYVVRSWIGCDIIAMMSYIGYVILS